MLLQWGSGVSAMTSFFDSNHSNEARRWAQEQEARLGQQLILKTREHLTMGLALKKKIIKGNVRKEKTSSDKLGIKKHSCYMKNGQGMFYEIGLFVL